MLSLEDCLSPCDDLAEAGACGDRTRELALKLMLRNFVRQHLHCEERHRKR
jgi:hypothetical protein